MMLERRQGSFFAKKNSGLKNLKKCYNKVLDQATEVAAYGGRADPGPNILLFILCPQDIHRPFQRLIHRHSQS
jgi:hypothetical protein